MTQLSAQLLKWHAYLPARPAGKAPDAGPHCRRIVTLHLCVPMLMAAAAQPALAVQLMMLLYLMQGRHWVLDPIDGTRGFVGLRQYAICLGLLDQGQVTPPLHPLHTRQNVPVLESTTVHALQEKEEEEEDYKQ